MTPISVLPDGRSTSALGFGCANLFRNDDGAASQTLIDAALDSGIRHFDVAPSYAWGQAEASLGMALSGHNLEVTIATKVGIRRPAPRSKLAQLRSVGAPFKRFAPRLWSKLGHAARRTTQADTCFVADHVRADLHQSLRELGVLKIDIYLLHNVRPADITTDLVNLLLAKKNDGYIGEIGLGSSYVDCELIASQWPELASVLQFPDREADHISSRFCITHGAIQHGLHHIRKWRAENEEAARNLSPKVGIDLFDDDEIASALLGYALSRNEGGIVLFSSTRPSRVKRLAAAASDVGFLSAACQRLRSGMQEIDSQRYR
ncbi:aldo/keto reductase [Brevundimonas sp. TWP2-3-4b1]|uniref:aldo/keto reductase n=1 Tax=Brevundimonas sp. TWP2-3-4b1 TaxID=2804580 RepID=UPI003CF0F92C